MPVKLEFPKSTDPANILRVQDMIFSMPGTWEIRVSLPSLHGKPKDLVALTTEIKE
jgi:hypothetical protein